MDWLDPAKRAEFIHGQRMEPCPSCGSYKMMAQVPIVLDTNGSESAKQTLAKWVRATKSGATPVEGPAYYVCEDCGHKGPAVDCTGRTSEDCRSDPKLASEMKRLWNSQGRV